MSRSAPPSTRRALFAWNDWARERLLAAASSLGDADLDRPFEMGPGTLRRTLQHLWRAERWWLDRWQGRPDAMPPPEQRLPPAELGRRFRATAAEREAYLDEAGPDGERRRIAFALRGRELELPLGDLVLHVCNHGAHHRAQAGHMCRRLGGALVRLDYLFMIIETTARPVEPGRDAIAEFYRYADWARARVHETAARLDDEQLDRPFDMGLGTLRRTLLHVHDAERWWLENWTGRPPERFEALPDSTSLPRLAELFAETAARRRTLLAGLDAAGLRAEVRARPAPDVELTFTVGDSMLQLCGHGTHHRAQAANMLRHLGVPAPGLDYCDWALERAGNAAPSGEPEAGG